MRALIVVLPLALAACGGADSSNTTPAERGAAQIFFDAMADELAGAPSEQALRETARFDHGGIRFDYPKPLRISADSSGYPSYSISRGDIEVDVHFPDFEHSATDYLDNLVDVLGANDEQREGPLTGRTVHWCGQEVTGVVYRFHFMGDAQIYEGFDLPAGSQGSRFIVFGDMPDQGFEWTPAALTTFDVIGAKLNCGADARPGKKIPAAP